MARKVDILEESFFSRAEARLVTEACCRRRACSWGVGDAEGLSCRSSMAGYEDGRLRGAVVVAGSSFLLPCLVAGASCEVS